MSTRAKVRSKTLKQTLNNKDVLDMFQGVIGTDGAINIKIAHPKYMKIQRHVSRFIQTLEALRNSGPMTFFPRETAQLVTYIESVSKQFAESFNAPDIDAMMMPADMKTATMASFVEGLDYDKIPAAVTEEFVRIFTAAKSSNLVNSIIVTCKNLTTYKKYIGKQEELRDKFMLRPPSMFAPVEGLPTVNFKQIYIGLGAAADRKYILTILNKMYTVSHEVYEAVSSPDVDVDAFVEIIMSSVDDVKKHIPRCDEAFSKIVESVDLLKGNFGGYYKDYIASNNPTIIMENFVLDVSKETKSSPKVTAQFRRIISHYRKVASDGASEPKLQSLFQQVDKNFQELEKKDQDTDDDNSDSDEEAVTTSKPPAEEKKVSAAGKKNARRRKKAAAAKSPLARGSTGSTRDVTGSVAVGAITPAVEEPPTKTTKSGDKLVESATFSVGDGTAIGAPPGEFTQTRHASTMEPLTMPLPGPMPARDVIASIVESKASGGQIQMHFARADGTKQTMTMDSFVDQHLGGDPSSLQRVLQKSTFTRDGKGVIHTALPGDS